MCVCVYMCVHVHLWVLVLRMTVQGQSHSYWNPPVFILKLDSAAESGFSRCLAVGGVSQISQISVSS